MDSMLANEIREKFLKFFEERGHKILPSSSLIPDDSSVLFTTAGMQQFKPYYTNPESALKDFGNKNVTTVQKCVRTGDIDEVGDNTHLTFFEMLGNFSFGGYGRKEAIKYAHEFITKEMNLDISYVTVYEGTENLPEDIESIKYWEELGVKNIKKEGADVFWGPTGDSGPCGPTTEIYCKNASGEDVEIWNIVFNEYFCDGSREKLDKGEAKLEKLSVLGVDTGMGLERLVMTVQKKESVYDTDLFVAIINKISELSNLEYGNKKDEEYIKEGNQCWVDTRKVMRIITDHLRTAVFMIDAGVVPSNTDKGYILRRLLRRVVRLTDKINIDNIGLDDLIFILIKEYGDIYPNLVENPESIIQEILQEEEKFRKTLDLGLKEFQKGEDPFILFTTYGFPIELTQELAKEKGVEIDLENFNKKMEEHQKFSQTSSAGMFKGGLADNNENTVKLHTAHHLLLAGLQAVVDPTIKQKGSNINEDRLRIDFLCDHKLTNEEKKNVEEWVNDKIQKKLKMVRREMPIAEAEKMGAEMEFGIKYPDIVSVYVVEDGEKSYSKEFCAGPHVENTKELSANPGGTPKHFKIKKEESVASGIRRIKAVLE